METLPRINADLPAVPARPPAPPAPVEPQSTSPARARASTWRRWATAPVLAVMVAALGIVALHVSTASSIVSIWSRSDTFAHGFIVVPLCLWLVWRRTAVLESIAAAPWWPGLAGVLGGGALWLVMSAADVLGVKQFALAFMIQAAIITVVGLRVSRVLLFPLVFLVFAIPVGEIFVPRLIDWTADFTVWALRASGVPVYREANHFVIPSGMWSVVEACSGIRYIIASVMVGTIYAAVAYRSTRRRVWFVVASILAPIVANWLRAYMIVMLGHVSDNEIAVGVDHLIYGWLFFGLVMLLLFWVGSFWQEAPLALPAGTDADAAPLNPASRRPVPASRFFAAAAACVVAAGLWVPLAAHVAAGLTQAQPAAAVFAGAQGWEPLPAPIASWTPHYRGFAWDRRQSYRKDGNDVGLYVAYFRNQSKGRELVTSGNQLTTMEDVLWKQLSRSPETVTWAGRPIDTEQVQIGGPRQTLDVMRLYWVDGRITGNEYMAKALTAWSKLRGAGDDSALIVLYTPQGASPPGGAVALREFAAAMSPSIQRELDRVRAETR